MVSYALVWALCVRVSLPGISAITRPSGGLSPSVVGSSGQVASGSVYSGRKGDKTIENEIGPPRAPNLGKVPWFVFRTI